MADVEKNIGKIKTVKEYLFDYFVPPMEATELFELRKEKSKLCKNGHDILICTICKEYYCFECKHADLHSKEIHAGLNLFISLLNGECILITQRRKIKTKSLYENKIGVSWTQERETSAFKFNKELYDHIM